MKLKSRMSCHGRICERSWSHFGGSWVVIRARLHRCPHRLPFGDVTILNGWMLVEETFIYVLMMSYMGVKESEHGGMRYHRKNDTLMVHMIRNPIRSSVYYTIFRRTEQVETINFCELWGMNKHVFFRFVFHAGGICTMNKTLNQSNATLSQMMIKLTLPCTRKNSKWRGICIGYQLDFIIVYPWLILTNYI